MSTFDEVAGIVVLMLILGAAFVPLTYASALTFGGWWRGVGFVVGVVALVALLTVSLAAATGGLS